MNYKPISKEYSGLLETIKNLRNEINFLKKTNKHLSEDNKKWKRQMVKWRTKAFENFRNSFNRKDHHVEQKSNSI